MKKFDKKKSYDDYSYRQNKDYYQSFPMSRFNPYSKPWQYSTYAYNPGAGYNSFYNNYPYRMRNPFLYNDFLGNNNYWSPFSSSYSTWPNYNNGRSGNNPLRSYPNIRTPGFFSR